nr:transposase [Flexithrix dorotheae]
MVFTIPEGLHGLFYINQRVCYNLLFQAAWQSLQKLVRNPQFLSAQPGAVAVLHTWGQTLTYHPHIHISSTAGSCLQEGFRKMVQNGLERTRSFWFQ